MVVRRRKVGRAKRGRPKRIRRIRPYFRGYRGVLSTNFHKYKRSCDFSDIGTYDDDYTLGCSFNYSNYVTLTADASVGFKYFSMAIAFALNDVPAASEFTSLYDQYKLSYVRIRLYPLNCNGATWTTNAHNAGGVVIHTVVDNDDTQAVSADEAGIALLRQYNSYRMFNNAHNIKCIRVGCKPKAALAVYDSAISTGYAVPSRSLFINCAKPEVPHYGVKMLFEMYNATATALEYRFRVSNTYYFTCKDVR